MEQSHYWGFEKHPDLFVAGVQIELPRAGVVPERGHFVVNEDFDLSEVPYTFDFAIADRCFRQLSLNSIARCFASVIRKLSPDGRFYVSWPEVVGEATPCRDALAGRQRHLAGPRAVPLQLRDAGGDR